MNNPFEEIKGEKRNLLKRYLIDSEKKTLLAFNIDAISTLDLDGVFIQVNPSFETLFGYSVEELKQRTFQSLVLMEELDNFLSYYHKSSLGQFHSFDCRIKTKIGQMVDVNIMSIPIEVEGVIVGINVVAKDIIQRKEQKTEEDVWNRKNTFRDIVEHSPDAVFIAKKDKIIFVNETGVGLIGASCADDIINKSIFEFVPPQYHMRAKQRLNKVVNGETTDFADYKIIRLDGTTFDAELKGMPTFFQNESAHHIIIRDITERKKTQELLLNSEKLTIAGQLAAGIAHEVRNPLTAIKGFLQLMEAQLENKSYFEIIQSEINRIDLILSELLVLAKPQDLKFAKEKIDSLIEEVKTLIGTQAIMKNVQIKMVNNCTDLTIKCDKNQMKQVLINFLKNSIEAMPNGGYILIEIKKHCIDKVKILFKDTGIGIPQHLLKRIGEPFFTTKENGTGLGIMISKQIIENHNGTFHFWSDEKGTIIEVILPIT